MKKIFTLLALAAGAMSMSAAVPTLYFGDTPVEAGKVYKTGYTVDVQDFGALCFYSYLQDSDLFIEGSAGAQTVVHVVATAPVQVCSLDGKCEKATDVTKEAALESGKQSLMVEEITQDMTGADPATLLKNIEVEVTAYYKASPSETVTAKVILSNLPASEVGGIAAVGGDESYVRQSASNVLSYKVGAPTRLEIYAITGSQVLSKTVSGVGTLSLDALPAGIYIYRAGKISGKAVIR